MVSLGTRLIGYMCMSSTYAIIHSQMVPSRVHVHVSSTYNVTGYMYDFTCFSLFRSMNPPTMSFVDRAKMDSEVRRS